VRTLPPRLGPFAAIGGIGFVVQVGLLSLLTRVTGLDLGLATALAVELTILHNFAWHERWTWAREAAHDTASTAARLLRFNAAALGTLALNLAVTVGACRLWHLPPEAANLLAVAIGSAANYAAIDGVVLPPDARRAAPDNGRPGGTRRRPPATSPTPTGAR
jgi:putative flippase GtrA